MITNPLLLQIIIFFILKTIPIAEIALILHKMAKIPHCKLLTYTLKKHIHFIFDELKRRQCFLVTAESLTGGLIAQHITAIPGASAVFWGGWVTYSAQAKQQLLNVPPDVLDQYGVVSIETAKSMAQGALALASAGSGHSCYAIAVTGLAGPAGGRQPRVHRHAWRTGRGG